MRKTKMARITLALLLSVGATSIAIACSTSFFCESGCHKRNVSKEQAEKIAGQKIYEYCQREGLSVSQFSTYKLSSAKKIPWIFDYTSNTSPHHFVRIHIDECGVVEVSREIYKY